MNSDIGDYRLIYLNVGLACANGDGDSPLDMLTIDDTGAACSFQGMAGVPVVSTPIVAIPALPPAFAAIAPVPEPSTLALVVVGLAVMARVRRKSHGK